MITFSIEKMESCWNEWREFLDPCWASFSQSEWSPNEALYRQYNDDGTLLVMVGRDKGKMVAYCGVFLIPSIHHNKMIATEDFVFIHPDYRRGKVALRFYQFCEREVAKLGADVVNLCVDSETPAERYLLASNYTKSKIFYTKQLT